MIGEQARPTDQQQDSRIHRHHCGAWVYGDRPCVACIKITERSEPGWTPTTWSAAAQNA